MFIQVSTHQVAFQILTSIDNGYSVLIRETSLGKERQRAQRTSGGWMPSSKHGVRTLSSKTQGTRWKKGRRTGRMAVPWPRQSRCNHDLPAAVTCSRPAQDWPWRRSVIKTHVALSFPDERLATETWGGRAVILFSCVLWTSPLCSNGYFRTQAHTHGRYLNRTHHTKQSNKIMNMELAILSPFGLYYLVLVFCLCFKSLFIDC